MRANIMVMDTNVVEVVLVEDNEEDALLTMRALKKHNLANHLLHLRSGEEVLDFLFEREDNFPKLILLDLKMPKVDGIEVLRRLRKDDKRKLIPVVMLTSSKEEKDVVDSYRLGVNAYIVKPVDFEQFSKAIVKVGFFWVVLNQPPY